MTPEQLQGLKRRLQAKGFELSQILSALMSGKRAGGADLLDAKPGETPEEKVRRYLALINRKVQSVNAGTYGRCETCAQEIEFAYLDTVPWMEVCRPCHAASQVA
jgi:RNA polymerase-binding transcription factor DksA